MASASAVAALALALTHPADSVISFDEGFHGGSALFLFEAIRHVLGLTSLADHPVYLYREFTNGVTLYPPLWKITAAALAFVFGPSTATFRATTSLFYGAALMLTAWFAAAATRSRRAGAIALIVLATMPMVMIYSHLMMLEVPLMTGVTAMVVCFYAITMGLIPRTFPTIALTTLVFIFAPLTKLPALPVAWAIIVAFATLSSAAFYRQRFYRRFLRPEIFLWLAASLASVYVSVWGIKTVFGINMIDFFIRQSQNQTSHVGAHNPLLRAAELAWSNRDFYLRDFRHMPWLAFTWSGAVVVYLLIKRHALAILLACWVVVTYAAFSGVSPQVPQYIMPIYVPLALAPALLIDELGRRLPSLKVAWTVTALLTLGLGLIQIGAMAKSEGYGWRANRPGYELAATALARQASPGERVVAWYDGVIYALRVQGLQSRLQIAHGGAEGCLDAIGNSFDWAIVTNVPPFATAAELAILNHAPWEIAGRFGSDGSTVLYHNRRASAWPVDIQAEAFNPALDQADAAAANGRALQLTDLTDQPSYWGCLRLMPFGPTNATFVIKATAVSPEITDNETVIRLEYAGYPSGEQSERGITAGELRRAGQGYGSYVLPINHAKINLQSEFRLYVYRPATILFDKITLAP